jgi:outer membrane protein OmpA-like peptidoglycan-associated protein
MSHKPAACAGAIAVTNDYTFKVSGRGEADPAVPNASEKNRKLNRRVELTHRPGR